MYNLFLLIFYLRTFIARKLVIKNLNIICMDDFHFYQSNTFNMMSLICSIVYTSVV